MSFPVPWLSLPAGSTPGSHVIDQTAYEAILASLRTDSANRNGGRFNYANIGSLFVNRIFDVNGGQPIAWASGYNFETQAQGASATQGQFSVSTSGGTVAGGGATTTTFTLSPVPPGVNGTDVNHWIRIHLGTGTAESFLITGGTAVAGASTGTITGVCNNSHSGVWKLHSATSGIQEAIQELALGGLVRLPAGTFSTYAPVHPPYQYTTWIRGAGRSATVINVAAEFALTHAGVFDFSPTQVTALNADSGGIADLTISFIQPDSTTLASYTHWPPAVYASGNNHVTIQDTIIEKAWDAITSPLSNGLTVRNVGMSFFHRGLTVDQCFDVLNVTGLEGWPFGCTVNQTTVFVAIATNNYLLDLSQVDFGWLNGVASASGKFGKLQKNGGGQVPVIVGTNIDMDTNGGFEMSNGCVSLSNVSISLIAGSEAVVQTGGTLSFDGITILNSGATATHFLYNVSQANAGAAAGLMPGLTIRNLKLSSSTEDGFVVYATSSSGFTGVAHVSVEDVKIVKSPGVSYASTLFAEATGTGSVVVDLSHVRVSSNGGTAASFANFSTALNHSISFCEAPGGWDWAAPTSTRVLYNSGFPSIGIPVYANNAAALVGGLSKGQFYRTGADPDPVCVVR